MLRTDRLIQLRKAKNLIQQDMADFLQITRPAYVRYERGQNQPPNDALGKLADYFGVSTDYLLDKTDNPSAQDKKKEAPPTFEEIERAYLKMLLEENGGSIEDLELNSEDKKELRGALRAMIKGYKK